MKKIRNVLGKADDDGNTVHWYRRSSFSISSLVGTDTMLSVAYYLGSAELCSTRDGSTSRRIWKCSRENRRYQWCNHLRFEPRMIQPRQLSIQSLRTSTSVSIRQATDLSSTTCHTQRRTASLQNTYTKSNLFICSLNEHNLRRRRAVFHIQTR